MSTDQEDTRYAVILSHSSSLHASSTLSIRPSLKTVKKLRMV